MSEPVFVDASAWVAIANRSDRYHGEATRAYHRLLRAGTPFITSTWTVYEALSIVKTKLGYHQAERLWERVRRPSVVNLIRVNERVEAEALQLFWRYQDKDWGVVDCSSLRIMNKLAANKSLPSTDTLLRLANNTVSLSWGDRQA
jgi:predicted nucleic acid-binding protein